MRYLVILTFIVMTACSPLKIITVCSKKEQNAVKEYVTNQSNSKLNQEKLIQTAIICNCHQVVINKNKFRMDSTYISNIISESVVVE